MDTGELLKMTCDRLSMVVSRLERNTDELLLSRQRHTEAAAEADERERAWIFELKQHASEEAKVLRELHEAVALLGQGLRISKRLGSIENKVQEVRDTGRFQLQQREDGDGKIERVVGAGAIRVAKKVWPGILAAATAYASHLLHVFHILR